MKSSRAYHGGCFVEYMKMKYIIAVGGQQTQKSSHMVALSKKDSDTVSASSSGFELDIPRNCIPNCELYDIKNNKWIKLPDL